MMNTRVRLIEVGLVATLGVMLAAGVAAADRPAPAAQADERELNYIYFHDDDNNISMSGDMKDVARARRFKRGNEPILWFRTGGQDYVVRDGDTLQQVRVIWKPERELDEAEEKLDSQENKLDVQQDQLGAREDALRAREDALGEREDALDERASSESLGAAARAEIARQRQDLRQQKDSLAKEIRALEPPRKELRAQLDAIRAQARALHQKQRVAARQAQTELRALFRRTIAAGVAKPAT